MDIYELGGEVGDWIEIAKDMEEYWMLVGAVMSSVRASKRLQTEVKCYVLLAVNLNTLRVKKTNLMHYLSSVYFINQPLCVLGVFVANHQEVYCIYTAIGTCCIYIYSIVPDDRLQIVHQVGFLHTDKTKSVSFQLVSPNLEGSPVCNA